MKPEEKYFSFPTSVLYQFFYLRKSRITNHKAIKIDNKANNTVKTGYFHCKNSSSFSPPKKPSKMITTI